MIKGPIFLTVTNDFSSFAVEKEGNLHFIKTLMTAYTQLKLIHILKLAFIITRANSLNLSVRWEARLRVVWALKDTKAKSIKETGQQGDNSRDNENLGLVQGSQCKPCYYRTFICYFKLSLGTGWVFTKLLGLPKAYSLLAGVEFIERSGFIERPGFIERAARLQDRG